MRMVRIGVAIPPRRHPIHLQSVRRGDIISMMPDAGESLEISAPVFLFIRVVPEIHRHGGKGRFADKLPLTVNERMSFLVKAVHIHPQAFALNLSTINRQCRASQNKTRYEVRTA